MLITKSDMNMDKLFIKHLLKQKAIYTIFPLTIKNHTDSLMYNKLVVKLNQNYGIFCLSDKKSFIDTPIFLFVHNTFPPKL